MIVDDEKDYAEVHRKMLERMGSWKNDMVSPSNVLKRLKAETYDLVLLDFGMRELQGDVVCKHIRGEESLKDLPVIIITGYRHMAPSIFKAFGATDVLYKPVEYDSLKKMVQSHLKLSK